MAANLSDGQKQQIVDYLQKAGMTPEQAIMILQDARGTLAGVMVDALHAEFRKRLLVGYLREEDDEPEETKPLGPITLVPVGMTEDYSTDVETLTANQYKWREPRALQILSHLRARKQAEGAKPKSGSYMMEKLTKPTLLPKVLADIASHGYEPSNAWALALYSKKHPTFQQDRTIVAAGELENEDEVVIIKNMAARNRFLATMATGAPFPTGTSFLVRMMNVPVSV